MAEDQKFELSFESKYFISKLNDDDVDAWLKDLDKVFGLCKDLGKNCTYLVNFREIREEAKELKAVCLKMREAMDGLMDYLENESSQRWDAKAMKGVHYRTAKVRELK